MKKLILFGLLAFAAMQANAAPTVNLAASPSSGVGVVSVTLTWSSTEVTSCMASGGWAGTKAASGTEVVSASATTTYTLVCSAATGQATTSWTPPTQNTDGSPLTNLASYKLYHATTAGGVPSATPIVVTAPATSHVITGLPAGLRYYGIRAVNAAGVESAMSNLANNTVVIPSATANATVTVQQQPQPPTGLTVQSPTARLFRNGDISLKAGKVTLGTACGEQAEGEWHVVPREEVKLSFWGKIFKDTQIVARCA